MHGKINDSDKDNIIQAYRDHLIPMIEIAKQYNVNRGSIYQFLKKAGIDTSKKLIAVSCSCCQATITRPKKRIRNQKHLFCDRECYFKYVNREGTWKENRHASRIARDLVKEEFKKLRRPFLEAYRVHHIDKNQYNNELSNLMVFANQGDHIRFHRGFEVSPVWEGRWAEQSPQPWFKTCMRLK